ncbi:MAG: DUF4147 domain-containing protein [bacterium]|nr:DUF4147 domain-containing protein [bacterium]
MNVQNYKQLAVSELRKKALAIAEAGLGAIGTKQAILEGVRFEGNALFVRGKKFSLNGAERIHVVAVGKAALDACVALEEVLGRRLARGVCLDVRGLHNDYDDDHDNDGQLQKIQLKVGTHPFPSEENVRATKEIIDFLSGLDKKDFVLFVISGGGSTLLVQPLGMGVEDEQKILKTLFAGGANIKEMNTIRKHISRARGGLLAKYVYPASSLSLIFSDVPGDDVRVISSGPTVRDSTTIGDARRVMKKYRISLPEEAVFETPKEAKYFKNAKHVIFVSNKIALKAMAGKAKELGLEPKIRSSVLQGEAREVGIGILKELREASSGSVFLYGGETTVTVRGDGEGGRNQEVSLGALSGVREGELLLSFASDGRDNSRAAGGMCDILTKRHAKEKGLSPRDFLKENDSFHFFQKTGDALMLGRTGSNVSDLIVTIKE